MTNMSEIPGRMAPPGEDDLSICRMETVERDTRLETNITPDNGWLEYYFHFGMAYFLGQKNYLWFLFLL